MTAVRLVVSLTARPGKGAELAEAFRERAKETTREDGCLQFDVFRSPERPDQLVLLELWRDQAALDAHAKVLAASGPVGADLRLSSQREDYAYNRTR